MSLEESHSAKEYCFPHAETPSRRSRDGSVHYGTLRFEKAAEQAELPPCSVESIIELVNDFLRQMGMSPCAHPILYLQPGQRVNYLKIQRENGLADQRDIAWMKFTRDGYLGVVAVSNDIGFDMPESRAEYNQTLGYTSCKKWRFSTSGILVHALGKQWDDSFALVFPLKNIPNGYDRHRIETGIGNYLIGHGVPILDFYSHNY